MAEQVSESLRELIEKAQADKELPHIYFNGFANSLGSGDVTIVLRQGKVPIAVLNTSFTVAKTLATKLGELVAFLEERTAQTIMTTDDVAQKLEGGSEND